MNSILNIFGLRHSNDVCWPRVLNTSERNLECAPILHVQSHEKYRGWSLKHSALNDRQMTARSAYGVTCTSLFYLCIIRSLSLSLRCVSERCVDPHLRQLYTDPPLTLSPPFSPWVKDYRAEVPFDVVTLRLRPEPISPACHIHLDEHRGPR
jgi:hypothetical protein